MRYLGRLELSKPGEPRNPFDFVVSEGPRGYEYSHVGTNTPIDATKVGIRDAQVHLAITNYGNRMKDVMMLPTKCEIYATLE